jgi:hypothetical protein
MKYKIGDIVSTIYGKGVIIRAEIFKAPYLLEMIESDNYGWDRDGNFITQFEVPKEYVSVGKNKYYWMYESEIKSIEFQNSTFLMFN